MSTDVEFNLQGFLADMRSEMLDGFYKVHAAAQIVRADLVTHEKLDITIASNVAARLVALEKLHDNVRWVFRTAIAALIVGTIGLLFAAFSR